MWKMSYLWYLSTFSLVLCFLIAAVIKYLTLHRWRIDYRRKETVHFSGSEVLGLLKRAKILPVSNPKGWKLIAFRHRHRVWTNQLITRSAAENFASIQVFAASVCVNASSQMTLNILKDVSQIANWKPGVTSVKTLVRATQYEDSTKSKTTFHTLPLEMDKIKEEQEDIFNYESKFFDLFPVHKIYGSSREYKRFWHREENGCCWLLQIEEELQHWIFYLSQPVEEVNQSFMTVITHDPLKDTASSVNMTASLLGSLFDYFFHRKLQCTPLLDIKVPHSANVKPLLNADSMYIKDKIFSRFKSSNEHNTQNNSSPNISSREKNMLTTIFSILRHNNPSVEKKTVRPVLMRANSDSSLLKGGPFASTPIKNRSAEMNIPEEPEDELIAENDISEVTGDGDAPVMNNVDQSEDSVNNEGDDESSIKPSLTRTPEEKQLIKYQTQANHTAASLLAQVMEVSNVDLNMNLDEQAKMTGGWIFCGLEKEIVIMKKISKNGCSILSYLGKGIVNVPPEIVWKAVRSPRTRFTYDESLKKVDVVEKVSESINIVNYYHEVQQLFKKESYEFTVLHSERIEGEKYILSMESVVKNITRTEGTTELKVLPSGWIIEPVQKNKKTFSMVTYLMQIDSGAVGADKAAFEELVSKQPLSIAFLRNYLKPAIMLTRRNSSLT